jgi:hypothetical protein
MKWWNNPASGLGTADDVASPEKLRVAPAHASFFPMKQIMLPDVAIFYLVIANA